MGFVRMKHPDVEALSEPVTEEAFDQVHRHKGWTLATDADVAAYDEDVLAAAVRGTDTDEGDGTTTASTSGRKAAKANKSQGS